ncbi:MAG: hypothetical protein R6U96_03635 [Promethearchaeia archaeon]
MDCYDKILKTYNNKDRFGSDYLRVWKNKALITLMTMLKEDRGDNLEVRNSLILLINLFDINSPDYCTELGESKDILSKGEKRNLKELLKQELN